MSDDLTEEVQSVYRRTSNLMVLIGFSIIVLLALNLFLSSFHAVVTESDYSRARLWFTIIVLVFGLGAISLRRFLFRSIKLQTIVMESGIKGLLAYFSRSSIVLAALADMIALCGFVSGILTGDTFHSTSLILVGVVILAISFPRRNAWLRAASATG